MLPYEQRFLSWLLFSESLSEDRLKLARRIGLPGGDDRLLERRVLDLYRKFRDVWGILDGYREGFGAGGHPVDRFELATDRLEADLRFLTQQGIDTLVSLTETTLDPEALASLGFASLHLPIPDRDVPEPEQVETCMAYLDENLGKGHRVLVHCLGGYGRTGTLLACYLVHCGAPAADALLEIRRLRPGSVENETQEAAIFAYEERIR